MFILLFFLYRSDAAQKPARQLLYRAEFLGPILEEEPSCAQLDGVSIYYMYMQSVPMFAIGFGCTTIYC